MSALPESSIDSGAFENVWIDRWLFDHEALV